MSGLKKMLDLNMTAVVGVSTSNPFSPGNVIFRKLCFENSPKTYPINPKGGTVEGQRVCTSLIETPNDIGLVVISVPAKYIPSILTQCGEKKINIRN